MSYISLFALSASGVQILLHGIAARRHRSGASDRRILSVAPVQCAGEPAGERGSLALWYLLSSAEQVLFPVVGPSEVEGDSSNTHEDRSHDRRAPLCLYMISVS